MAVVFVYNDRLVKYDYGPSHPLRLERLGLAHGFMSAYGLLDHPKLIAEEAVPAGDSELTALHKIEYLAALKQANRGEWRSGLSIFGLGPGDNPVFPGVYDLACLASGASLQAARAVAEGRAEIAFNMAGGMHHAFANRAAGFCYVNDPVLAIMELVRRDLRVAYVDIDAHHGDGVQKAFYETDQVLTISIHQTGRSLFPGTGFLREKGEGRGEGYSINLPLLPYTDTETWIEAFEAVVPPLVNAFEPDILVTQLGVDALADDPLANLVLTDAAIVHACRRFKEMSDRWLALGGGGYHIVNVARCWTQALAVMLEEDLPDELPARVLLLLRDRDPQRQVLRDPPTTVAGPRRQRAAEEAKRLTARIKDELFPYHGLK